MARTPWHMAVFWSVAGGGLTTLCLYLSVLPAAFLLPPDVVMQAIFAVPVFVVLSTTVERWTLARASGRDRADLPGWALSLWMTVINMGVVLLLVALVFYGVATAAEAMVLAVVLFASGQGAIVWRLSVRHPGAG